MATTSNSAQPQQHEKQDFIEREMELTKEAMKTTASEIWQHVPSTDDVAAWTKANPMLAVGIAAGAGVLAGFMVAPSRGGGHSHSSHHGHGGGGGGMLGSIVGAVMPALSMAVSEASRTAVAAAVAHFAGQNAAEQHAQEQDAAADPYDTYARGSSDAA
jgi:ElaB/YqjD/DUF883 family membrane-anchored ribosome-binding protein